MTTSTTTTQTLAIDGGTPIRTDPMPTRRLFGETEKRAVVDLMERAIHEGSQVLRYQGEQEQAYCDLLCRQLGGGYADGVNSGTNAVYVALAALDLPAGSEVVVAPISDPGGAMPAAILGCVPVAADAAPGSMNTDAAEIAKVMTEKTSAILVAHIGGVPVDMAPILDLAKARGVAVVEDCAQAHGAKYRGQPVGTLGDTAAFSTMFGKHHASGGQGGLVYTQREDLYFSARRRADRGKPFGIDDAAGNVAASLNCNMDELHAVVGRSSLERLPGFVRRRRRVAERIGRALEGVPGVELVTGDPRDEPSYWFLQIRLDDEHLRVDRDQFAQAVSAEGLQGVSGYPHFPMRMPWATQRWPAPALPNARASESMHCRIGIHEGWTDADADDAAAALTKVARAYQQA